MAKDHDNFPAWTPTGAKIHRVTIGFTDQHSEWVKSYKKNVGELAGLVLEIIENKPECLLSPLFRQMLVEKAHMVKNLHETVGEHLYVDLQP